ncbi:hypothetical protein BY458DRAFT_528639 [Sporodiniella umbellata]|nr:hypothetical protein BY458DRAFT_528639 [Sporodiniella umbellata]
MLVNHQPSTFLVDCLRIVLSFYLLMACLVVVHCFLCKFYWLEAANRPLVMYPFRLSCLSQPLLLPFFLCLTNRFLTAKGDFKN